MQSSLHEHLNKEITRKQFLQYMAGTVLAVFGLSSLLSLLSSGRAIERQIAVGVPGGDSSSTFGSRRFGV